MNAYRSLVARFSILTVAVVTSGLFSPTASAHGSPTSTEMDTCMQGPMNKMEENMVDMRAQMADIRATTDAEERQRLMHAHMQAMKNNMDSMREMGSQKMMGARKDGDAKSGAMDCGASMESRMDMMQMMMEQMIHREDATGSMSDMH